MEGVAVWLRKKKKGVVDVRNRGSKKRLEADLNLRMRWTLAVSNWRLQTEKGHPSRARSTGDQRELRRRGEEIQMQSFRYQRQNKERRQLDGRRKLEAVHRTTI